MSMTSMASKGTFLGGSNRGTITDYIGAPVRESQMETEGFMFGRKTSKLSISG
jgi:hypothetical protein